ncbi:MAG: hypothetical protein GTO55_12155 [Armatimonadetes bacterium]|nr:hypothetical protein [Armatimonadota bacterium]NIM24965.1 hypothetical protein [Armatimonadota bacterium]NIM68851.1 hypothetical protein [Armatimonadota bacterium]NIM77142.1 hypothetical protein [Armatimonadota bacterium]NIN07058.1 hypothetical protein [Armatimonadota bacterium]
MGEMMNQGSEADQSQAVLKEAEGEKAAAEDAAATVTRLTAQQQKQEFYWKRQAEKLQREMEAARKAAEAEVNILRAEKEETLTRMQTAEKKASRLTAIVEAGLPPELAQLVPETDPEKVNEYIEKLRPLAERLRSGGPAGTLTNPARSASGDAARLTQLAASAGRGDRRALREYAHLREKMRSGR